jgi:hypothetical protein
MPIQGKSNRVFRLKGWTRIPQATQAVNLPRETKRKNVERVTRLFKATRNVFPARGGKNA